MVSPYPLILRPSYKHYLWGGRRILDLFARVGSEPIYAESWEASDREEGMSLVENGPLKGQSLKEILNHYPDFITHSPLSRFPLLIKLIDAHSSLSIQVHPNDQNASFFGGEPKSEMWYILDALPGSSIYLGLKQNLSPEQIKTAIEEGNLEQFMNQVPVEKGQTFYIPGGLLHSIGKGCLIYEVQQNSNTTYRLYDWNRLDAEGKSRPLHVEKALKVMLKDQQIVAHKVPRMLLDEEGLCQKNLLKCPYFEFNHWKLKKAFTLPARDKFRIFFVQEGELLLKDQHHTYALQAGQTVMIPPKYNGLEFQPKSLSLTLLETIATHS